MILQRRWVLLAACVHAACGQANGVGVSKYTLPCDDPSVPAAWLRKYLPVVWSSDSCDDGGSDDNDAVGTCTCTSADGAVSYVEQGHVQLYNDRGFGLHLVNSSFRETTGGLGVKSVEAYFDEKLGDAAAFDSFFDLNVGLYLNAQHGRYSLDGIVARFDNASVRYWPYSWTNATDRYYGIFVRVPNSMLVLELMSNASTELGGTTNSIEPRLTAAQLDYATSNVSAAFPYAVNDTVRVVRVSRPTSDLASIEAFYAAANATKSSAYDSATVSSACFSWPAADVDACYYERDASATSGDFKVSDLEAALNSAHDAVVGRNPNCQLDKWFDLHYAYDDATFDARGVMEYLAKASAVGGSTAYYTCAGDSVMYVADPSGYGVQLDVSGAWSLSTCDADDFSWDDVDNRHYLCEAGNCTSLANATATVVALSSSASDWVHYFQARGNGNTKKVDHGRHWNFSIVIYASVAFFLAATLYVFARRSRAGRYERLRNRDDAETDWQTWMHSKPPKTAA